MFLKAKQRRVAEGHVEALMQQEKRERVKAHKGECDGSCSDATGFDKKGEKGIWVRVKMRLMRENGWRKEKDVGLHVKSLYVSHHHLMSFTLI